MPRCVEIGLATGEWPLRIEEDLRLEPGNEETIRRSRALLHVTGERRYSRAIRRGVPVDRSTLQRGKRVVDAVDRDLRSGEYAGRLETLASLPEDRGEPENDEPRGDGGTTRHNARPAPPGLDARRPDSDAGD